MCHHLRAASLLAVTMLLATGCAPSVASPAQSSAGSPVAAPPSPTAPPSSVETPLETVRVGVLNIASDAPLYWAEERGYLREVGLTIETSRFDSAQRMTTPLGADQLDIGAGAPGPGLYNAIQRGINVRIVADRGRLTPGARFNCLVVRKELLDSGAVHGIADLRGHIVAENVPGTITDYVLDKVLRERGVDPAELTYVTVPFPDMLNAFSNSHIDAAFLVEPFITVSEQRGVSQCWRPTGDLAPNFQLAVLLYGPTFAEQRSDSARRFMMAFVRAVRDYYRAFFGDGQGRPELLDLITRTTRIKDRALLEQLAPTWMDPNGSVNVESLGDVQHYYFARGDMEAEVPMDQVVDTTFTDYAVERLGRSPTP
jgi:NitT/TauT family transport system substrate-binding protein